MWLVPQTIDETNKEEKWLHKWLVINAKGGIYKCCSALGQVNILIIFHIMIFTCHKNRYLSLLKQQIKHL
jgi:hypothetical protein